MTAAKKTELHKHIVRMRERREAIRRRVGEVDVVKLMRDERDRRGS